MKVLVISPGAAWSTADVDAGLRHGLESHGVQVIRYRLTERISRSSRALHSAWRIARKARPSLTKPTVADVFYDAGVGAIGMALRHEVDVVLAVSAMYLHYDVLVMMRRAGLRVVVLFTETPYDLEQELTVAGVVTGCWTHERTALPAFRAVNANSGYLPAGWHPATHQPGPQPGDEAEPAHDVVFVGSGWHARMDWFAGIDWTGIDLGLYGHWPYVGKRHVLAPYLRGGDDPVDNRRTAALYRRAKVGLNLYRETPHPAECLNPRAYELAACGAFHVSTARAEVTERFGDLVPIVTGGRAAGAVIRRWLDDDAGRAQVQAALPARVADCGWEDRARTVIGDVQTLLSVDRRRSSAATAAA